MVLPTEFYLQYGHLMCADACFLQLCGGKPSEGVFVGAFLSMSSTAVVILLKLIYICIYTSFFYMCKSSMYRKSL